MPDAKPKGQIVGDGRCDSASRSAGASPPALYLVGHPAPLVVAAPVQASVHLPFRVGRCQ